MKNWRKCVESGIMRSNKEVCVCHGCRYMGGVMVGIIQMYVLSCIEEKWSRMRN